MEARAVAGEDPDRFSRSVVDTIAKRAGNMCSNPDCMALTCGPGEEARAISVGEAAHIFGARPGSARHDAGMTSAARSAMTNAIWLCRNCHRQVDQDPDRFPHELLFEWRREHELHVQERVGVTSARLRRKANERQLSELGEASYLAEQIVLDKPYAWEIRLAAELVRSKLNPVLSRWRSLDRRLYVKPIISLDARDVMGWHLTRLDEIRYLAHALSVILNEETKLAWGDHEEPASVPLIVRTASLLAEACQSLLEWEERVRFVRLPSQFAPLIDLLPGVGGGMIDEVAKLIPFFENVFSEEEPQGVHPLTLNINLPDGWTERVDAAFEQIGLLVEGDDWS